MLNNPINIMKQSNNEILINIFIKYKVILKYYT